MYIICTYSTPLVSVSTWTHISCISIISVYMDTYIMYINYQCLLGYSYQYLDGHNTMSLILCLSNYFGFMVSLDCSSLNL